MAYVVCEPCHDCKYTDCVAVCPCDSFYQDESQLYIDPDSCIHCGACQSECPVNAIFPGTEVPAPWSHFITLNAERVLAVRNGGSITATQPPKVGPGCRSKA